MDAELHDLRAFAAVVEAGGFSRAAARLGLANEAGELAAPDHARLVDHEHVAAADRAAVVLPTAGP